MENIFDKTGYSLSSERSNPNDVVLDLLFIKNSDGSPRWIWSANSNKPLFLKFYNIGNLRARFFATAIKLVFVLKLQKMMFAKKRYFANLQENILFDYKKDWALFTGTIGPNNKAILYADNSFFKIALTENAKKLIQGEHQILSGIQSTIFITPASRKITDDVIQLSDISVAGKRTKNIGRAHLQALIGLGSIKEQNVQVKDWKLFNDLKFDFQSIDDSRIPKNSIRKINILLNTISENEYITLSFSQGDFTSWNLFENNGKIALYDWEMARFDRSKAFDYFHFIIQQGVLVDRKNWKTIYEDIKNQCTGVYGDKTFDQDLNILKKYLKWYLLLNCMHYLTIYASQPKWHIQIDWLLSAWNEGLDMFMTEEKSSRELIIMDLFDLVQNQDYAALKFQNGLPEQLHVNSDIDFVIEKGLNKKIVSFFKNHILVSKIRTSKKSFMNSIQVFLKDGTILSLDLIWQLKVKNLEILDSKEIIKNQTVSPFGIKNASDIDTARYITLFYCLNGVEIPLKYLNIVQSIKNSRLPLDLIIYDCVKNYKNHRSRLLDSIKKQQQNRAFSYAMNTLAYIKDTVINTLNNKGFVITFSGVDGAGKSTVIENIALLVEKQLRRPVVVLRHRPSLLPILSVWTKGKQKAHQDAVECLPRQGNNKSFISSLFRFSYYYFDYLIGQFVIYFKYVFRGYVVIYDRYYFDFINDSKRSNIVLSKTISTLGYQFLLKPKFNFFLFADAGIILKRKQELSKATIEKLTQDYQKLFQSLQSKNNDKVYQMINNIELDQTLNQVLKTIILTQI
jgi:thymidylate kinase